MSELRIFYHENGRLKISKNIDTVRQTELKDIIWIDLNDVSEETEERLEDFLKIYIQEDEEMEEIEMSWPIRKMSKKHKRITAATVEPMTSFLNFSSCIISATAATKFFCNCSCTYYTAYLQKRQVFCENFSSTTKNLLRRKKAYTGAGRARQRR